MRQGLDERIEKEQAIGSAQRDGLDGGGSQRALPECPLVDSLTQVGFQVDDPRHRGQHEQDEAKFVDGPDYPRADDRQQPQQHAAPLEHRPDGYGSKPKPKQITGYIEGHLMAQTRRMLLQLSLSLSGDRSR